MKNLHTVMISTVCVCVSILWNQRNFSFISFPDNFFSISRLFSHLLYDTLTTHTYTHTKYLCLIVSFFIFFFVVSDKKGSLFLSAVANLNVNFWVSVCVCVCVGVANNFHTNTTRAWNNLYV